VSALNRSSQVVVYDDVTTTNNPQRRAVDWRRQLLGIPVSNPSTQIVQVEALQEVSVFSGLRSLVYDGTTQFALTLSVLDPTLYRLAWTGTGAAPVFRTARINLSSGNVTFVVNANQTVTVTHSAGAVFGAVQVSDIVLVPGVTTGDTSLFDPLNEGEWTVIGATATTLTLERAPGASFSGLAETKTLTAVDQFQAYSATGVQVSDTIDFLAGFSAATRRSYKLTAVAAKYVEFSSSLPLAAETLIPGANSFHIYSAAKRYLGVESDQEVALKVNGATGEENRVEPMLAGDPTKVGWREGWGTVYSLSIKNRSTARASVLIITAE
jgi:hypothetical protein